MLCEGCQHFWGGVTCPRAELPTVSQAHDSEVSDQGYGEEKGAGQTAGMGVNFPSAPGNWLARDKVNSSVDLSCLAYKELHKIVERTELNATHCQPHHRYSIKASFFLSHMPRMVLRPFEAGGRWSQ